MTNKPTMCFVLKNNPTYLCGGAEIQSYFIAKELVSRGWEIHFVVEDNCQKNTEAEKFEGIIIHKLKRRKHFRLLGYIEIYNKLMDINPDICYQRTLTDYAGIASLFSKLNKKKFMWAWSHEIQCRNNVFTEMLKDYEGNSIKKFILQMKAKLSDKLYLFTKKHADEIIVQTQQ